MIVEIPQLICCGISMKSEILSDHAAPCAGAVSRPALHPHGHRPPLKLRALVPLPIDCQGSRAQDTSEKK
jgi:hypothetical protein